MVAKNECIENVAPTIVPYKAFFQPKNYIFHISPGKHMLWYSIEVPHLGTSNEYPQHMFLWSNKKKYLDVFIWSYAPLVLAKL